MRAFSLLLVVISLGLAWSQYTFTSPVFMWSNMRYFGGKNVHVSEYVSSDIVAESILAAGEKSPAAQSLSKNGKLPEAIFVFIEPELRTEHFSLLSDAYAIHPNGGAFSHLKATLENDAVSSLVIPFTHAGEGETIGNQIVTRLAQQLSQESSIVIASSNPGILSNMNGRVSRVTLEELQNLVNQDWSVFSNGVTDIICVCFDSLAAHASNLDQVAPSYAADDAYMYQLLHNVEANYVAIFTAEKPAGEQEELERANMMVRGLAQSTNIYPADVAEATIVMIPFLFILFVGIWCTFGVQSDLKFDAEKRTFKK